MVIDSISSSALSDSQPPLIALGLRQRITRSQMAVALGAAGVMGRSYSTLMSVPAVAPSVAHELWYASQSEYSKNMLPNFQTHVSGSAIKCCCASERSQAIDSEGPCAGHAIGASDGSNLIRGWLPR